MLEVSFVCRNPSVSKVECVTKEWVTFTLQHAIECLALCTFIKFAAKNFAEGANFCSNRK